ncbi:MAG TPA: hypothetical protein VKK61_08145, partial [Tepidisphaeraceae bacterium]|nr:hypothetical protein [Tepidisphaeraceae bacterium]
MSTVLRYENTTTATQASVLRAMATPPTRGTGLRCTFLELGTSKSPNELAKRIAIGVSSSAKPPEPKYVKAL